MGAAQSSQVSGNATSTATAAAAAPLVVIPDDTSIVCPGIDASQDATAIYSKVKAYLRAIQDLVKPSSGGLSDAQAQAIQTAVQEKVVDFGSHIHSAVLDTVFKANKKLEKRNADLADRIKKNNTKILNLESDKTGLKDKLSATQKVLNNREAKISDMSQQINKLESCVAGHDAWDAQIANYIDREKQRVIDLEQEIKDLKHEKAQFVAWQLKLKRVFEGDEEQPAKRVRRDAFSHPDSHPYGDNLEAVQNGSDLENNQPPSALPAPITKTVRFAAPSVQDYQTHAQATTGADDNDIDGSTLVRDSNTYAVPDDSDQESQVAAGHTVGSHDTMMSGGLPVERDGEDN
ncbi:Hypothetical protein D9617_5g071340 [Elsinoe fawcettii]|nr:Hypothetical protein D9617_5g071340 [Elsinoe fawcettii]